VIFGESLLDMRIILASKSPRRRELISRIFSEFEIVTAQTDETLPENMHPQKGVELLALRKGEAVLSSVPCDALVISSDTLVEIDGVALGKPRDEADALRILSLLSGRTHRVHTGVAVHYCGKAFSGVDTAYVKFRNFSKEEALNYIKTGEPMDKAGAYAIQGIGAMLVEKYEGDFNAIVGLGLDLTQRLIDAAVKND
jgi:septum formation protein